MYIGHYLTLTSTLHTKIPNGENEGRLNKRMEIIKTLAALLQTKLWWKEVISLAKLDIGDYLILTATLQTKLPNGINAGRLTKTLEIITTLAVILQTQLSDGKKHAHYKQV